MSKYGTITGKCFIAITKGLKRSVRLTIDQTQFDKILAHFNAYGICTNGAQNQTVLVKMEKDDRQTDITRLAGKHVTIEYFLRRYRNRVFFKLVSLHRH